MRTHQLKTAQEGSRERPYNVRFLCWEDERGKIKQAAGRDTGNVIPPWTRTHARTHTLSLYKELVMQGVEPLESKYAPAPVCFPVCIFFFFFFLENAIRFTCQKLTGVNPAAWAAIYARDVIPWTRTTFTKHQTLRGPPVSGRSWGGGRSRCLGWNQKACQGCTLH